VAPAPVPDLLDIRLSDIIDVVLKIAAATFSGG
jgi:hypothetical protein